MKLLVQDVELISSKRPINNAMPPPLRPWQRTLKLTNKDTNENRPLPVVILTQFDEIGHCGEVVKTDNAMKLMDFLPRNTNMNENRLLPVVMVVISLHVRVVSANDPANDTNTITITKFKYLKPLLRLKFKFLTDTFCKRFCKRFCTNTNTITTMNKPLFELMEKKDVELFVNTNVFLKWNTTEHDRRHEHRRYKR